MGFQPNDPGDRRKMVREFKSRRPHHHTLGPVISEALTKWLGGRLFIPSEALAVSMFAPGVISLVFYKRRPSRVQVILGLIATVVLSALLGYISPSGPIGQLGSVLLAIAGGVILYVAILAYLVYKYQPKHAKASMPASPAPAH